MTINHSSVSIHPWSHYCMPHTRLYVQSILNSTAAAGGFPDLAPWHTHTHTARYPSLPHWTFTHTSGWVSMETCTMQQEPVCLLKAECTFVHVHTNLHLTTRAVHMFIHLSHACANAAAPILHRSISMLPRDHPHPDHHWPIVAETATRLLTFKYQH